MMKVYKTHLSDCMNPHFEGTCTLRLVYGIQEQLSMNNFEITCCLVFIITGHWSGGSKYTLCKLTNS